MSFQLIHYFDPDFDHQHLKPSNLSEGRVDHYNLGYAQNVIAGQVLAEILPLDTPLPERAKKSIVLNANELPVGPNTIIHPKKPSQLISTANGYVFYNEGVITVKKMLNVRRDVDFHTGNIVFVGDVCVHGSVRSGFEVHGKNILIKGTVEGAQIHAQRSISSENGVKGNKSATLEAGGDIRLPFVENAEILARGDILIDGSCMHTDIYAEQNLVVKGRLQGGKIYANQTIYVAEQLGGGISTVTSIIMGYSPFSLRKLHETDKEIHKLDTTVNQLEILCAKSPLHLSEYGEQLAKAKEKLKVLYHYREVHWKEIEDNPIQHKARIVVPGQLRPGVEISIGGAYCMINDFMDNVCIYLQDNEIVIDSPAVIKK